MHHFCSMHGHLGWKVSYYTEESLHCFFSIYLSFRECMKVRPKQRFCWECYMILPQLGEIKCGSFFMVFIYLFFCLCCTWWTSRLLWNCFSVYSINNENIKINHRNPRRQASIMENPNSVNWIGYIFKSFVSLNSVRSSSKALNPFFSFSPQRHMYLLWRILGPGSKQRFGILSHCKSTHSCCKLVLNIHLITWVRADKQADLKR